MPQGATEQLVLVRHEGLTGVGELECAHDAPSVVRVKPLSRCGVDLESPTYKIAGAVIRAEENRRLFVSGLDGFDDGWFERGKVKLYVNRGIGVTGHGPMARRINCLSEITEFTLTV